jgi:hypothetical protein
MLGAFALTLFTSATLLFMVQPLVGKMILPLLGGTPEVWNTCMVFFQAVLLAGYAYAHVTTKYLGVRRQAVMHLVILLIPLVFFPLAVNKNLIAGGGGNPIGAVLLVLALSVGVPFFVVSTSAPLLQKWFSSTDHPAAKDPYFLYGASNLGSMLTLIGYPLFVEPNLRLAQQSWTWAFGYGFLILCIGGCAVLMWRSAPAREEAADAALAGAAVGAGELALAAAPAAAGGSTAIKGGGKITGKGKKGRKADLPARGKAPEPPPVSEADAARVADVTWLRRLKWVLLGAIPSSLLMGVTTYMTTDIAAIPLLWIPPLALYLLTFIIVFSKIPTWVHKGMILLMPLLTLLLLFMVLSDIKPRGVQWNILLHLANFFVITMVCHGELARDRPTTKYLTEYFMLMSLGGVVGGMFNALFAPLAFDSLAEYPLAMVAACLLLPPLVTEPDTKWGLYADLILSVLFLVTGGLLIWLRIWDMDLDFRRLQHGGWGWLAAATAVVLAFGIYLIWRRAQQTPSLVTAQGDALGKLPGAVPVGGGGFFIVAFYALIAAVAAVVFGLFFLVSRGLEALGWRRPRPEEVEVGVRQRLQVGGLLVVTALAAVGMIYFISCAIWLGRWGRNPDPRLPADWGPVNAQLFGGVWGWAGILCGIIFIGGCCLTAFQVRRQGSSYPIAVAGQALDLLLPLSLLVLTLGLYWGLYSDLIFDRLASLAKKQQYFGIRQVRVILTFGLPCVLAYTFVERSLRFGLGVAAILLVTGFTTIIESNVIFQKRSFFGVLKVEVDQHFHRLLHGTTLHGKQFHGELVEELNARGVYPQLEPLTYYHKTGPLGQVMEAYNTPPTGMGLFGGGMVAAYGGFEAYAPTVGIIGLGTGTTAVYGRTGQHFVFYDIDALVKEISWDTDRYFTYVKDAERRGVRLELRLNDARLEIERELDPNSPKYKPDEKFGILVVDAFSSDAIPIHLITLQALDLYLQKMREDGLICFHISNRYLDLKPVLGNLAKERDLTCYVESDDEQGYAGKAASTWVVLTRKPSPEARQSGMPEWKYLDRLMLKERWGREITEGRRMIEAAAVGVLPAAGNGLAGPSAHLWAMYAALVGKGRTDDDLLDAPWKQVKPDPAYRVWTDDFSNILSVFQWRN